MILSAGARLGPYEILASAGAGGMGEVYKARDTRLDRIVAIKVLTEEISNDARHRQRFEREARVISRLSHPHVCALYDVGEQDGVPFLVVEYLEGETLAYRLMRGPLPLDQAVEYAIQIADALDHAHRQGFLHRDLKPSNIMLTRWGTKLLDFGLAKPRSQETISRSPLAGEPGATTKLTAEGTILGTLQYMAPEQLNGEETDARTDIFAFGAVVYEMLTGRQAFEGKSQASVIAAILERSPEPLSNVLPIAPPLLSRIVTRCLAKEPDDRWQTAGDLKQALTWIAEEGAPGDAPPTEPPSRARRGIHSRWIAAGVLAAVAVLATTAFVLVSPRRSAAERGAIQFVVPPPENANFAVSSQFMAVSPDGRTLAFGAGTDDGQQDGIWVRPIDSLTARRLEGTSNAAGPFWSPDSRFVGFRARGLMKIDLTGGLPQTIASSQGGETSAWGAGEVIVTKPTAQGRLYRVSPAGGAMAPVTALDEALGETGHSWPEFLPDGRHFLFLARSTQSENDCVIYLGSLDSPDRVRLFASGSQAVYASPGYLIYMQGNTLLAHSFDLRTLRVAGEPMAIAEAVERNPGSCRGSFSVSQTGVLAYRATADTELVWFDRGGRRLEKVGPPGQYRNPALSPDEQQVAVARTDPQIGTTDIWLLEPARGGASRLTFDSGPDDMPVWSPDGRRVAFKSRREGRWGFYRQTSGGGGPEELLLTGLNPGATPYGWSPDEKFLVYSAADAALPAGRESLWLLPWVGDRKPVPFLRMPFSRSQSAVSPDGRWIAYVSQESGRAGPADVYVSPFPTGDGKTQISVGGGMEPQWRRDGRELFFLATNRDLMAVQVTTGATFTASPPVRLFGTALRNYINLGYDRNQYLVAANGQRFLIKQNAATATSHITVVVNWPAKLRP